jgi:hypothetical protein
VAALFVLELALTLSLRKFCAPRLPAEQLLRGSISFYLQSGRFGPEFGVLPVWHGNCPQALDIKTRGRKWLCLGI